MSTYSSYRLLIQLKSQSGTPWQADTLMGHLIWLVAHQEGAGGVKAFLDPFIKGQPPFVLSDGFPLGLLPRPVGLWTSKSAPDLDSYVKEKSRRKAEFIKFEQFEALRKNPEADIDPVSSPWIENETLHAAISRISNTTTGEAGTLFSTDSFTLNQEFWSENFPSISVYAYCTKDWGKKVEELFHELSQIGFGRDKSVGLGQFKFCSMEPCDFLPGNQDSNGFTSLSTYVPAVDDPTEGTWDVNVKYGKLGENAGGGNPFKKPLLQLKPGAVFYTGQNPRPFYGKVVKGLAPGFPEAVQICYCLAVPCRIRKA